MTEKKLMKAHGSKHLNLCFKEVLLIAQIISYQEATYIYIWQKEELTCIYVCMYSTHVGGHIYIALGLLTAL